MPQELLFVNQMLSNIGSGWLPAVMLVGLLLALLYRPEKIHNWPLFRFSCWFLGISIIITPLLNIGVTLMQDSSGSFGSSMRYSLEFRFIITSIYAIAPVLQGISILCGLFSMIPVGPQASLAPPKHPLE